MQLWWFTALLLILSLKHSAFGKEYEKCELARELHQLGVEDLADWMCLANAETDGKYTTDYDEKAGFGLFGIPVKYCGYPGARKGLCQTSCLAFMDGKIADDFKCAQTIHKKGGFRNWRSWKVRCETVDREKMIEDCYESDDEEVEQAAPVTSILSKLRFSDITSWLGLGRIGKK